MASAISHGSWEGRAETKENSGLSAARECARHGTLREAMQHVVYIMGEVGTRYVKIGRTTNIAQRRQSLQAGNPRNIVIYLTKTFGSDKDAEQYEKDVHASFAQYRASGEWFDDSERKILDQCAAEFEKFAPRLRGRPSEADEKPDRVTAVPERIKAKYASLPYRFKSTASVKALQEHLHCTRAVARLLAKYGEMA